MEIIAYKDHVIQQRSWSVNQALPIATVQARFLITIATVLQLIIGIRLARHA